MKDKIKKKLSKVRDTLSASAVIPSLSALASVPVIWTIANVFGLSSQYLSVIIIATFIGTVTFGIPMAVMRGASLKRQVVRYLFRASFGLLNGMMLWFIGESFDILRIVPNLSGLTIVFIFLAFYLKLSWLGNRLNLSFLQNRGRPSLYPEFM